MLTVWIVTIPGPRLLLRLSGSLPYVPLLLALVLVAGAACLPRWARPTPTPLPAPQGLGILIATPTSAPNLVVGIGDPVVVGALSFRVLAFQLPEGPPPRPSERYAAVRVVVRQLTGPGAELIPWAQMHLEDGQGRRFQPELGAPDGEDSAAPFRLEAGQERELRLVYRLPRDAQRVRWLFVPAGAGEPALTVDFGPLPPEGS